MIIAAAVFLSMGSKRPASNKQEKNRQGNPAPKMVKKVMNAGRALRANAVLVYAEVPQQLYPGYPLRHIQIQGM
jgi:hypothetical protein